MNCDNSANRDGGSVTPIANLIVAMAVTPPDETCASTGTTLRHLPALLDAAGQLRGLLAARCVSPVRRGFLQKARPRFKQEDVKLHWSGWLGMR